MYRISIEPAVLHVKCFEIRELVLKLQIVVNCNHFQHNSKLISVLNDFIIDAMG